jgi:hypothetical protein
MGTVDNTLAALVRQMQEHANLMQQHTTQMQQQSAILARLSEQLGPRGGVNEGEASVNNTEHGESRLAGKKVKLPLFDGEDPVAWITRAEIYFDVQNTADDMRVKLARLSMEGSTIHWFNLLMETEDLLTWERLKKALIARYGGRRLENPFEELSTLKQTGTVEEFTEAFELLSSQVGRLPEEQYLGYFMSGLKPTIRRRVRTLNPQNRMEMMRIAKDVEEELREEDDEGNKTFVKKNLGRNDSFGPGSKYRSGPNLTQKDFARSVNSGWSNPTRKPEPSGSHSNSNSSLSSTGRKFNGDRRSSATDRWKGISTEEMEERRAKGQCFKCKGKWHPTQHKCPEGSLRLFILGEGESINEEGEIVMLERVEYEEGDEDNEAECKVIGVMGKMGEYQTMKIEGRLEHVGVEVLIDSGASHNFISPALVTALGMTLTPSNIKRIKLGDGHKVLTEGVCKRVSLTLGTKCFEIDALVLELGGLDVVLGVSWLSTLGKVVMDWKDLTMQFLYQGDMITLQGYGGKHLPQNCLNSFLSGLWNNEEKPAESDDKFKRKSWKC